MPVKYNLAKMLEEIKEDDKIHVVIEKKWASQADIRKMLEEKRKKETGK